MVHKVAPPRPHLLLADGRFDGSAILKLAHSLARDDIADAARRGRTRRYKVAFRSAWITAQTQRWCRERDAALDAMPADHAVILAERTAALIGIDSGRRMVAMLDARAAEMGVRL